MFKTQPIDRSQLRFPVAVYRHVVAGADNCSITGGYVYRGSAIPRARAASTSTPTSAPAGSGRCPRAAAGPCSRTSASRRSSISSFGEGSNGELYVVSLGGTIYKIVP